MAAGLAYLLPRVANETEPEAVLAEIVTTNPLRAALSFLMYIAGQEVWQEMPEPKPANGEAETTADEGLLADKPKDAKPRCAAEPPVAVSEEKR